MPMNPRLLRPLATGFNPRSIAGLQFWLDGSDAATLGNTSAGPGGATNNGPVKYWGDKSGLGRHVTQTGADSVSPTLLTAARNGRSALSFDGGDELRGAMASLSQPYTIYVAQAITPAALGVANINILSGGIGGGATFPAFGSNNAGRMTIYAGSGTRTASSGDLSAASVLCGFFDGSSSEGRLNGSLVLTGGTSPGTAAWSVSDSGFTIGTYAGGGSQRYNGQLYEVLLYSGLHTTAVAHRVEGYLAWKWGMQSQLPYDHPYAKSFPGFGSQTTPTDSDTLTYLAAVKAADGTGVEVSVANAINDFVVGCKADGIWTAIKASCILAGARTLAGALTPLVGSAPTNNGPFVSGDYNRKTGLVGNASSKYLDTNRNNNADGQDSNHQALWLTSAMSISQACIGAGGASGGSTQISTLSGAVFVYRSRNQTGVNGGSSTGVTGFLGMSRAASAGYDSRDSGTTTARTQASQAAYSGNVFVFARESAGSAGLHTGARIAFYSVGEALNLSQLDARVSTLITAIGAAI